ncbi:MTAP family purine nucleoside phosphorylase [Pleomorphochaeta sp. DL1XJH-081]|jgi:purine nucleoside phosphorylase|uniref:MTAP family purine nucleoside phosphorylase n=1 Tax=Pleomorphochaeta sp. DL1XJH-081 TaxID=3409690 RepID=UPI003BB7E935
MKSAIIGGTGCQAMAGKDAQRSTVVTPYGETVVFEKQHGDDTLYFALRHGEGHRVPPHLVNYRAIIAALKQLGVSQAIGIYAVGSITSMVLPGNLGLIDQFIDFTGGQRQSTFFTGGDAGVQHIPMLTPYSKRLRAAIAKEAARLEIPICLKGTYICTNGPRLETPAEIAMFRRWGGDYVGMTAATETTLANEAGIDFAGLVYSINWAAGLDAEGLSFIEDEIMQRIVDRMTLLASGAFSSLDR